MVTGSLAGRVGTVRLVAVGLGESRVAFAQGAVILIGRHVLQAEPALVLLALRGPIGAHGFEQVEGPHDVGLDEILGTVNRAVDVRFRGEVDDCPRPVLFQQATHQREVADIALAKLIRGEPCHRGEILQVAGVSQLVQIEDRFAAQLQPVEDKVGPDEAGAARHQNHDSKTSASARLTPAVSLADRLGRPCNGHSIAICGSSQAMQRSCSGA